MISPKNHINSSIMISQQKMFTSTHQFMISQQFSPQFPSNFHHFPRVCSHLEHFLDLFLHGLRGQEPGHHVALGNLAADLQEPVDLGSVQRRRGDHGIHGENDGEIFWKYMENMKIWEIHGTRELEMVGQMKIQVRKNAEHLGN